MPVARPSIGQLPRLPFRARVIGQIFPAAPVWVMADDWVAAWAAWEAVQASGKDEERSRGLSTES